MGQKGVLNEEKSQKKQNENLWRPFVYS
jgi:hypothetical protein